MLYYLKKCGHQELGSVGIDGKPHRGRYLLTSMNNDVLRMFPPLSTTQLNDSALLAIVSLYSGKKVYCNFVYHNDKFHGSTASHPRNEYRLYLNRGIENNQLLFKTDDIVIIRKGKYKETENIEQDILYLDIVKPLENETLYKRLDWIVENSNIKGGYALYNGIISEFEEKVSKINMQIEVVVDKTVTEKIEHEAKVSDLFSASTFRDFVMVGYQNLCAVTGTVIRSQNYVNLESAHIKPRSHGGLYLPNNGLALSRDMHWAFDKGFFTIDNSYKIIVHEAIDSSYLNSFNRKTIRIPRDDFFKPNIENLEYHRRNIFGLFLQTGRL